MRRRAKERKVGFVICQLKYDIEHEAVVFRGMQMKDGDKMEVLIPDPGSGELVWTPVQIIWETKLGQQWRLTSDNAEIDAILETCDPAGLFAKR